MKKAVFLFFLFVVIPLPSQTPEQQSDEILYYKYSADLTLGFYLFNNEIFLETMPSLSYWPTYWMSFGMGYYYQYRKFDIQQATDDINVHGARATIKFFPIKEGCFVLEYRHLWYRTNLFNYPTYDYQNIQVNSFIAGIGFIQALTDRFYIHTLILYDFFNNEKTPYSNPLIQSIIEYRFNLPSKKKK